MLLSPMMNAKGTNRYLKIKWWLLSLLISGQQPVLFPVGCGNQPRLPSSVPSSPSKQSSESECGLVTQIYHHTLTTGSSTFKPCIPSLLVFPNSLCPFPFLSLFGSLCGPDEKQSELHLSTWPLGQSLPAHSQTRFLDWA